MLKGRWHEGSGLSQQEAVLCHFVREARQAIEPGSLGCLSCILAEAKRIGREKSAAGNIVRSLSMSLCGVGNQLQALRLKIPGEISP